MLYVIKFNSSAVDDVGMYNWVGLRLKASLSSGRWLSFRNRPNISHCSGSLADRTVTCCHFC
jgi:hypothetical protein